MAPTCFTLLKGGRPGGGPAPTGTGTDGDAVTDDENPGGLEPYNTAIRVATRKCKRFALDETQTYEGGGGG